MPAILQEIDWKTVGASVVIVFLVLFVLGRR